MGGLILECLDNNRYAEKNVSRSKILFIATVYTHLAAFHIPFMRLLQDKGYEVHAAASPAEGRKEEIEAIGVKCWDIPFTRSPYSHKNLRALRELKHLLESHHVHTPEYEREAHALLRTVEFLHNLQELAEARFPDPLKVLEYYQHEIKLLVSPQQLRNIPLPGTKL